MSRADANPGVRDLPETLVRSREGRAAKRLHRQDPDSDDPRPKCKHADDRDYGHVEVACYPNIERRLCRAPACFGDRDRQGGEHA